MPKKGKKKDDLLYLNPLSIRFQHSRIRPYFSGCGRRVEDTLQSIREGKLAISDLPPIQVIPLGNDEYVSLNNRRLWVFQECGKLGICDTVGVRVRQPKSQAERERYSVDKCALSTTFMREKPKQQLDIPDDEEEPEAAKPSQSLTTS